MKNLKFTNLKINNQSLKKKIFENITKVLNKNNYILGEEVHSLEEKLKKFTGSKYCISLANGTDALLISLMSLGIKKNDEIITSPFSWISTSEVIKFLGAKPVYVDIGNDFLINSNQILNKITKKTKAIIPVSLFGQTADLSTINKIAKIYNISVIEDGAQSFGAKHNSKYSCSMTDIGCTSFFPTKPLGCFGDGGACFTNNKKYAEKIFALRNHGKNNKKNFQFIGLNSRLDTIQAAILLAKFEHFKDDIIKRKIVAKNYDLLIKELAVDIITPIINKNNSSVYAQYTITSNKRNQIANLFKEQKIPFAIYYDKLIPENIAYRENYTNLKNSNRLKKNVISLPIYPDLKINFQKKIVKTIYKAFK